MLECGKIIFFYVYLHLVHVFFFFFRCVMYCCCFSTEIHNRLAISALFKIVQGLYIRIVNAFKATNTCCVYINNISTIKSYHNVVKSVHTVHNVVKSVHTVRTAQCYCVANANCIRWTVATCRHIDSQCVQHTCCFQHS